MQTDVFTFKLEFMRSHFALICGICAAFFNFPTFAATRPSDIVDLLEVDPTIVVDMMYFTPMNFVGRPIRGYRANVCLLTKRAAVALGSAQRRLRAISPELTLIVRDCYRPVKSVRHFLEWVRTPGDISMKALFYPELTKSQILELGYIAPTSGHSRASTIDVTFGRKGSDGTVEPMAMGTRVDFFGEKSHVDYPGITPEERANRARLVAILGGEFRGYAKEWWHYVLKNEPYPSTAFDFDVE